MTCSIAHDNELIILRMASSLLLGERDREPGNTVAMIVGVDRAASQMEDLQSADSLGRRPRALIRAPSSTIHTVSYSFSQSSSNAIDGLYNMEYHYP